MLKALSVLVILTLAADRQTPQNAPPTRTLSGMDRGVGMTMLRQVKADLKDHYYDKSLRGLDLDAVFDEGERRMKAATTVSETVAIIADIVMRLNDTHTIFIPPDRKTRAVYGWQPSMVGNVPYVVRVVPGSDAEKKGLAPGDRVVAWNRFEPTRENLHQIYYLYRFVRPQAIQHVVVRKPDGAELAVDVESKLEVRERMDLSDLLEEIQNGAAMGLAENHEIAVGDTFVWRYGAFFDPKDVDRVMKKVKKSKNLVLDLRGNGGGSVEAMRTLIGHLFERDVQIGVERSRGGDKEMRAKGRSDAFTGPLTVLVDSDSGSAAEIVARVIQIEKRGKVVGDRTAGAVMAARLFPHAVGLDAITFFATMITVGDVRMSDGTSLEHAGVVPDEIMLPRATDLATKRDPALAHAILGLGGWMTPEDAGRLYK
jgi:C-terminal processing protease CtpA/Prc